MAPFCPDWEEAALYTRLSVSRQRAGRTRRLLHASLRKTTQQSKKVVQQDSKMKMEYNEENMDFCLSKRKKVCQLNSQCPLAPQPKENENAPQRLLLPPPLFSSLFLLLHHACTFRVFAFPSSSLFAVLSHVLVYFSFSLHARPSFRGRPGSRYPKLAPTKRRGRKFYDSGLLSNGFWPVLSVFFLLFRSMFNFLGELFCFL